MRMDLQFFGGNGSSSGMAANISDRLSRLDLTRDAAGTTYISDKGVAYVKQNHGGFTVTRSNGRKMTGVSIDQLLDRIDGGRIKLVKKTTAKAIGGNYRYY